MEGQPILEACEHVRSTDPRHVNQCVKCGTGLDAVPVIERDPAFERQLIENACEGVGLSHVADSINAMVSKRIFDGPVQMPPGRDLIREWFEEVADGFAYGAFELQRLINLDDDNDQRSAYLQEALRHSVLTFAALKKAQQD